MADWKAPGVARVSPFVMTAEPQAVIDFATRALGAKLPDPPLHHADGSVWHATLAFGEGTVMVGGIADPAHRIPAFIHLYVPDCDQAYADAIAAGATSMMPPSDQFYGERAGGVVDPAGNTWWLATFKEELSREELEQRARDFEAAAAQ